MRLHSYVLRNHESLMCADDINAHIYDLHYTLLVQIILPVTDYSDKKTPLSMGRRP